MRLQQRLACCLTCAMICACLLMYSLDPPSDGRPCANSTPANQTLHQHINRLPPERLILRAPRLPANERLTTVFLVISAAYEREERAEIRRLWAARHESTSIQRGAVRVLFVVGRSSLASQEAESHGDLLQVDMEESYRNMVYKIEIAFRWVRANIQSQFVAKIDSDTVVHIDRLHEQMRMEEEDDDWLACFHERHAPPIRDECSPWFVSEQDYSQSNFSTYCNGPAYVMKRGAFDRIVDALKNHKVIEVEDAFFTGVVAGGLNISVKCLDEVISPIYTEYSLCSSGRPSLSIVPTHFQFAMKSKKNLTAAWLHLKQPLCLSWPRTMLRKNCT